MKIAADGKIHTELPGLAATSLAFDNATSNLWLFSVATRSLSLVSPQGEMLKSLPFSPTADALAVELGAARGVTEIAFNPKNNSLWAAGSTVFKCAADGAITATCPISFSYPARNLIPSSDGGIWMLEGSTASGSQPSTMCLMHLDADAQADREIPLDLVTAGDMLLDEKHNLIWLSVASGELLRVDLATGKSRGLSLKDANISLEPATGCLWAATREGVYRIDPEGNCLWHEPSKESAAKWVLVMPQ